VRLNQSIILSRGAKTGIPLRSSTRSGVRLSSRSFQNRQLKHCLLTTESQRDHSRRQRDGV